MQRIFKTTFLETNTIVFPLLAVVYVDQCFLCYKAEKMQKVTICCKIQQKKQFFNLHQNAG